MKKFTQNDLFDIEDYNLVNVLALAQDLGIEKVGEEYIDDTRIYELDESFFEMFTGDDFLQMIESFQSDPDLNPRASYILDEGYMAFTTADYVLDFYSKDFWFELLNMVGEDNLKDAEII